MTTRDQKTFVKSGETRRSAEVLSTNRGPAGHLVLKPEVRVLVISMIVVLSFAACLVVGLSVGTLLFLVCLWGADHLFGLLAVEPNPVGTASEGPQATASFVGSQRMPALVQDSWLPMTPRPTAG
jgi:hypothetical protein